MKVRLFIFLLLPLIGLLSCAKDQPAPQVLKTSEHNLHFSGNGGAWLLTVNSNTGWEVRGTTEWCTVDKTEGYNTGQVIVTVSPNQTRQARSTQLLFTGERHQVTVAIQQDTSSGEYHYQLPVVFHILYSEINDTLQNIKSEVISQLIERCNEAYRNEIGSVNMNLELIPATQDPGGVALEVPGIHRILRSLSAYQSCETFMNSKNTTDAELLWDPNQYVNVYVYTFSEKNTLGISHLPFTPRQSSLIGLEANNAYYTQLPAFPYGISLNNSYIYEENAYKTLAHELGHYLGLLHVFAEKECGDEKDNDYCDDTRSYNRQEYESWLLENVEGLEEQEKFQRTGCDGITFTSRNIMDYEYSYQDQFTADQFLRIRHVLEHSPLIPGPKNVIVTKGLMEDELPEVRVMK